MMSLFSMFMCLSGNHWTICSMMIQIHHAILYLSCILRMYATPHMSVVDDGIQMLELHAPWQVVQLHSIYNLISILFHLALVGGSLFLRLLRNMKLLKQSGCMMSSHVYLGGVSVAVHICYFVQALWGHGYPAVQLFEEVAIDEGGTKEGGPKFTSPGQATRYDRPDACSFVPDLSPQCSANVNILHATCLVLRGSFENTIEATFCPAHWYDATLYMDSPSCVYQRCCASDLRCMHVSMLHFCTGSLHFRAYPLCKAEICDSQCASLVAHHAFRVFQWCWFARRTVHCCSISHPVSRTGIHLQGSLHIGKQLSG